MTDDDASLPELPKHGAISHGDHYAYAVASLRKMLGTTGLAEQDRRKVTQESPWVQILYGRFREDAQKNNDRVYDATRIYLPLSLAPLATLLAAIDDPSLAQVLLMATGSVGLLAINVLQTAREREDRTGYFAWMIAIQDELGLPTDDLAARKRLSTEDIRRGFLVALVLTWIAVVVAQQSGWLR